MDPVRFDTLVRSLLAAGTRRGLVRLLAALPVAGVVASLRDDDGAARGRREKRKDRHRQKQDRRETERNQTQHKREQARRKAEKKGKDGKRCTPTTCAAEGKDCGMIPDGCGGPELACGPCPLAGQPCTDNVCGICVPECGGNVCSISDQCGGTCNDLQQAIDDAADDATLTLCAEIWHLTTTVTISSNKKVKLVGAGAGQTILDRGRPSGGPDNGTKRVLLVDTGAEVTLENLTITGGDGAGFFESKGGGIFNDGDLTLTGVSVTNSIAGEGGGIYNHEGLLTLAAGSSVSGNTAQEGAGIYNLAGTVTLQEESQVTGNTAQIGAGIFNKAGDVTLQADSRVTGNFLETASFNGGGGVYNDDDPDAEVTVETGAIICGNDEPQCTGTFSGAGTCPTSATCS